MLEEVETKPMSERYIGVKIIEAREMCLQDAEIKLGRTIDHEQKPTDKPIMGYLVKYGDGYQSWSPKEVFEKAYRVAGSETVALEEAAFDIGMIDEKLYLPSLQERVIQEEAALFNKLRKLIEFFETETFKNLPVDEQERLKLQSQHMVAYWTVLIERTQNFK